MLIYQGTPKPSRYFLEHYGRKGMKWYQHIFGEDETGKYTDKYARKEVVESWGNRYEYEAHPMLDYEKMKKDLGPYAKRVEKDVRDLSEMMSKYPQGADSPEVQEEADRLGKQLGQNMYVNANRTIDLRSSDIRWNESRVGDYGEMLLDYANRGESGISDLRRDTDAYAHLLEMGSKVQSIYEKITAAEASADYGGGGYSEEQIEELYNEYNQLAAEFNEYSDLIYDDDEFDADKVDEAKYRIDNFMDKFDQAEKERHDAVMAKRAENTSKGIKKAANKVAGGIKNAGNKIASTAKNAAKTVGKIWKNTSVVGMIGNLWDGFNKRKK